MDPQNAFVQPPSQQTVTPQPNPLSPLLLLVGGLTILFVGLVGGYYLAKKQSNSLSNSNFVSTTTPSLLSPTELPTIIPSPTVINIKENLTIQNGDIYNQGKLIISHTKFASDSIQAFTDLVLSPDNSKICFIGWPPAPVPLIYISDIVGGNVTKIAGGNNCVWSNNSLNIAFNNHRTDVGPIDIYTYDLNTKLTKNISQNIVAPPRFRIYSKQQWSSDNSKITGSFVETDGSGMNEKKGSTEFDLATGKTTDSYQ